MRYKINKKGSATCSICGSIYPSYYIEVDHLHELRRGDLDEDDNVRPLCKSCHYAKTHAHPI